MDEDDGEERLDAYDDVSGTPLHPKKVYAARMDEATFIHNMKLYDKVSLAEYYEKFSKAPIGTKSLDVNKGDDRAPKYRSRCLAKDIAHDKQEGFFVRQENICAAPGSIALDWP